MIRICFHGAESTGKSTIARKLGAELGHPVVAEHGRDYAETHGTDFAMADLLAIARGQDQLMRQAAAARPPILLLDTDPLMTAAWAEMLFGSIPGELLDYPKAEQYLLFGPDVPWVNDGTRMFGSEAERTRFAAIAKDVLVGAGVSWREVAGDWAERELQTRRMIDEVG